MKTEKTKIEELYENKKSKGFINHLIKAYLPLNKVIKIWDFDKGQKHKCNVCGQSLFSITEYFDGIGKKQKEISEDLGDYLIKSVNGEELTRNDHPIIKHVIGDKVLGWTGEKTDTLLCHQCIEDLLILSQNGIIKGDKNIVWLTNTMQRNSYIDNFNNVSDEKKKEFKKVQKKLELKKTTFADLGVLQKLKNKMEE